MTVLDLIKAERERQINSEGFTPEHDDAYGNGELTRAATSYIWHGTPMAPANDPSGVPATWPWPTDCWKPRDRRSNLLRGGALCLAEKDKRERAGETDWYADQLLNIAIHELEKLCIQPHEIAKPELAWVEFTRDQVLDMLRREAGLHEVSGPLRKIIAIDENGIEHFMTPRFRVGFEQSCGGEA